MANPQRKPTTESSPHSQFTSGPCGDDPCFDTLVDQLNQLVAPIVNAFGGNPPGGGGGGITPPIPCGEAGTQRFHTIAEAPIWLSRAVSGALASLRAYDQIGISTFPGPNGTAAYLYGCRDLPASTSGSFEAWLLSADGRFTPDPNDSSGTLVTTDLKGVGAPGPMIGSPDGRWMALTRKRGGTTASLITVRVGDLLPPQISGFLELPQNPSGPAEGTWMRSQAIIFMPTFRSDDLLWVISVEQPQTPILLATVTSADCDLTDIRAVRLSRDEHTLFAAGDGGVASFNVTIPSQITQDTAITDGSRIWDSLAYYEPTDSQADGWLFVCEHTSSSNIASRTIDVPAGDQRSIAINTSQNISGSFSNNNWEAIRPLRAVRAGVGAISVASTSTGTLAYFDLTDLTAVTVQSALIEGLDSTHRYGLINDSNAESNNVMWLQQGLDAEIETFRADTYSSQLCVFEMDQISFRALANPVYSDSGYLMPPIDLPAVYRDTIIPNLNADLLQGFGPSDFAKAGHEHLLDIVTVTANTTIDTDNDVVLGDATGGAITITLPAAANFKGRQFTIKKIDVSGNAVTIDGNASETIDDTTTRVLSLQYDAVQLVSDGTEWWII